MMEGNYLKFIQERQKDPAYSGKKVIVEYVLSKNLIAYRVTDEGKGFDHKTMAIGAGQKASEEMLTHGRGLLLIQEAFDEVKFNDIGNQILAIKHLK